MARRLTSRECILQEIQMITGIQSDDFDFLVYKLLEGGCYFSTDKRVIVAGQMPELEAVEDVAKWFKEL